MTRSFLRLTVTSVLLCWALGFVALVIYSRTLSWTEEAARRDGVFVAHRLLEEVAPEERPARLSTLAAHLEVPLRLMPLAEVERLTARRPARGAKLHFEQRWDAQWFFIAFDDADQALAAGPVNPASVPAGMVPIGIIVGGAGIALIAAFVAVRVNRELAKVDAASRALAAGELDARVDNESGPSRELAESFNAMAERVQRLIQSRDELVQAVSHELGSPLSRLRFHLELLEGGPDARLAAMTRELDALDALVAELLGYVQSDELVLDRQVFEPSKVLGDLAELAQLEAGDEHEVEVRVEVSPGVRVDADQRLFQRAVENVLRNAVRHASSTVRLAVVATEAGVRVEVHDDGPGIPEALAEKVLAPFFRLDRERARQTGGVGLGLAIVSRIVERHGGRIVISRSPLGGALVAMIWPGAA